MKHIHVVLLIAFICNTDLLATRKYNTTTLNINDTILNITDIILNITDTIVNNNTTIQAKHFGHYKFAKRNTTKEILDEESVLPRILNITDTILNINDTIANNKTTIQAKHFGHYKFAKRNTSKDILDEESDLPTSAEFVSRPKLGISNDDIERRAQPFYIEPNFRREYDRSNFVKHVDASNDDRIGETSTSKELKLFKQAWQYKWNEMKRDALHSPMLNINRGMQVNVAAARPWSIPCGDPGVQDTAWGTCTLNMECDAEFRIYRGDSVCQSFSEFICCAVQKFDYDMYQALDASFVTSSSGSTSSLETLRKEDGSKRIRKRKEKRYMYRAQKAKYRRKRKIKRSIRRLEKAIRKELNRAFRNHSHMRQHTARNLMILMRQLKKKLKLDRYKAKIKYDQDLKHIDWTLQEKLDKVRLVNHHFLMNDTFRDIVLHGTPKPGSRRSGGGRLTLPRRHKKINDYLDYDVEFGLLI